MKVRSLVIIQILNIYFAICEDDIRKTLYKSVEFHKSVDIIGECSTKIAAKFFSLDKDVTVILHKNFYGRLYFLKSLVTKFTILLSDKIHNSKARENLIIMSNNLPYLEDIFSNSRAHLYSHYLVFTQMPIKSLIKFADSLRKQKYAYVVFLIIHSERSSIEIYQQNFRYWNGSNTDINLSPSGLCYNHLLFDVQISGLITPFKEILCPITSRELRFIRVDYGATKEELYEINKNGTLTSADSYGGCVLKAFAKLYNLTIAREEYISNYNWSNTIQILNNGEIDVAFGPTLPPYGIVADLEKVVPYAFEEFIFIDAIPELRPPIHVLVAPLGLEVWICFGLVALFYFIYVVSITSLNNRNMMHEKLNCMHLIAIFFNQVIPLPKKLGVRLVICMWLVYAFLINAIYMCNFTSAMIKIESPNKLQSFRELQFSERKLGGPDVAKEWLFDTNDPIMMNLYNRYEVIHPDNTSHALYKLGVVVAQTDYLVTKSKMTNFYSLKEKIVSYPLLYYMPKGHPFAPHIAKFMEKIREKNVPLPDCLIHEADKFVVDEFNAITMIHLQIVFKILTLSHFMSIMIFIVEYLM